MPKNDDARKRKKIASDRTQAKVLSDKKRADDMPRPSASAPSKNLAQQLGDFFSGAAGGAKKLYDRSKADTARDVDNATKPLSSAIGQVKDKRKSLLDALGD